MKSRETDGFEWLKGLILKERAESIKGILRQPQIVSAFVVDVSEGIGTFECKSAGLFESGDCARPLRRMSSNFFGSKKYNADPPSTLASAYIHEVGFPRRQTS